MRHPATSLSLLETAVVLGGHGRRCDMTGRLDTEAGEGMICDDTYPQRPNGGNLVPLTMGGTWVNPRDADMCCSMPRVHCLTAAGSRRLSDLGFTLWTLDQMDDHAQCHTGDAVIDHIPAMVTLFPQVKGCWVFQ